MFITYPYNDLKNEIDYWRMNNLNFSYKELFKILKVGIIVLWTFNQNNYRLNYSLTQYSICIFKDKEQDKMRIKIFEIDTKVKKFSNNLNQSNEDSCK